MVPDELLNLLCDWASTTLPTYRIQSLLFEVLRNKKTKEQWKRNLAWEIRHSEGSMARIAESSRWLHGREGSNSCSIATSTLHQPPPPFKKWAFSLQTRAFNVTSKLGWASHVLLDSPFGFFFTHSHNFWNGLFIFRESNFSSGMEQAFLNVQNTISKIEFLGTTFSEYMNCILEPAFWNKISKLSRTYILEQTF